ncbi:unnamed protein product [marine sediment metagenome]|uniref:Uncharacterized protein n=1 Tax=marine sediment metagenome TaxID=412755 RepID=X0SSG3_9ZZZZ
MGQIAPPVSTSDSADPDAQNRPTAEDLLKALQRKRPVNEVIAPATASEWPPRPLRQALLPEGSAVVSRSGWLVKDGRWWRFRFDPASDDPPVKLLPNSSLEVMISASSGSASPVMFVVSGEMTEAEGENYLLIRVARRAVGAREQAVEQEQPEPGLRKAAEQGTSVPDQADRGDAQGVGGVADAPVEDVLEALKRQKPKEEMMPAVASLPADQTLRDAAVARTLIPEGAPLVNRPGRLLRQADWWTFTFESDHPEYPEPPMKILPSKSVELMARVAQRGVSGLVFLVSGEVTLFQGENYLLPRVATRRIDTGNLRK